MSQFGEYDSDEDIDINPDQAHDMLSNTDAQVTKIQAIVKGRLARKDYVRRKHADENPDTAEARAYRREVTRKMMDEEQWRRINDNKQAVNFEDTAKERFERKQRSDFAKGAAMREKMRRVNEQKFEEMKHSEQREEARMKALRDMDGERVERLADKERQAIIESQSRDRGKRMSLSIQAAAQARAERVAGGQTKLRVSPLIEGDEEDDSLMSPEQRETKRLKMEQEHKKYALAAADVNDYKQSEVKASRDGYCSGGACSVM